MLKETYLREEIALFIAFFKKYLNQKLVRWLTVFEKIKSLIVVLLIAKRGKYQQSFLNTLFFMLVISIWIAGPIIAENNPLVGKNIDESTNSSNVLISMYSVGNSNLFTTKISQHPRDSIIYHKVASGDTLASIAKKFDISVDTIKWENDLDSDDITIGETLKIPPITGIVHKVVSGDTVYSIAEKYNTDAQKIANFPFNEFADLDTFALVAGQILYVPEGTPPSAAPHFTQPTTPQFFAGQTGSSSFIWPTTGAITQYPIWYHMALDIANSASPPVIAADSGTVSYSGCIGWGYGCHVIIDHGNGYQSLYGHLSSLMVSAGQGVSKGSTIGIMGSTGRSTGAHLHFEIRENGALANPLSFLQ